MYKVNRLADMQDLPHRTVHEIHNVAKECFHKEYSKLLFVAFSC